MGEHAKKRVMKAFLVALAAFVLVGLWGRMTGESDKTLWYSILRWATDIALGAVIVAYVINAWRASRSRRKDAK